MGQGSSCCRALAAERSGCSVTPSSTAQDKEVEVDDDMESKEEPLVRQRSRPRRRALAFHKVKGSVRLLLRGPASETWLVNDIDIIEPGTVKLFPLPIAAMPLSAVHQEISTLASLGQGHVNVLGASKLFLTPTFLGLIMEPASGGSLASYLGDRWRRSKPHSLVLPEAETLYFFKQLVSAMCFCHKHNLVHRNLTLDNIMLDGSNPPVLKICDFSFANDLQPPRMGVASYKWTLTSDSQTYWEDTGIKKNEFDPRSEDVHAAGVMLVLCLCGAFPFEHVAYGGGTEEGSDDTSCVLPAARCSCCVTEFELLSDPTRPMDVFSLFATMGSLGPTLASLVADEVIRNWQEGVDPKPLAPSPEAADLIRRLLAADPKQRISVEEILEHPWYNRPLPPRYQAALEAIAEEQADLDHRWHTRCPSQEKIADRQQAITEMVAATGSGSRAPAQQQPPRRKLRAWELQEQMLASIDLREAAILDDSPSSDDYGTPEDVPASPESGSPPAHPADRAAAIRGLPDNTYFPVGTVRG